MVKKTVFINERQGKAASCHPRKLTAKDRRRISRWEKQVAYANEHNENVGFKAVDDGPEYETNTDPMNKVDKALATPFPKDVTEKEEEKHEDVMHRVVNHAHQRDPRKKWS